MQRPALPPRTRPLSYQSAMQVRTFTPVAPTRVPQFSVPAPVHTVPIPVRRPKAKAKAKAKDDDFFQDFWKQIVNAMSNEIVVMTVVIVVAVVALHLNDHEEGPLKKLIAYLKKDGKSTTLGAFVETHIDKLIGALIFIPTVWPIRKDQKVPVIVFLIFWILVTPAFSALVYFFQAMTVYLYLKLNKASHKIIIVFIAGFVFMFIFSAAETKTKPSPQSPNPHHKTQTQTQTQQDDQQSHTTQTSQTQGQQTPVVVTIVHEYPSSHDHHHPRVKRIP